MLDERAMAIEPMVGDSIAHNTRTISQIRNLTSYLFGAAAGTLGLESYSGFLFYFIGSMVVSLLIVVLRTDGQSAGKTVDQAKGKWRAEAYFEKPVRDLWLGEVFGGLSGYILTWTLFYGMLRA